MKTSDLDVICKPEKQHRIHKFAEYCCEQLGIDVPELNLKPHNDTSALGYTSMEDGSVTIVVGDRHQMDIMRTLAHELVHCKQMTTHTPCGDTGSKDENEANALAGVLMREWGQQNPDLFTEEAGKTSRGHELRKNRFFGGDNRGYTHDYRIKNAIKKKFDKLVPDDPDEKKVTLRKKIDDLIHQKELEKDYWDDYSFAEAKKKMPAQDRLEKRAAELGIGTPDKEKFYADMKKKFQQSLDSKKESTEDLEESKAAKIMALITALGATYGLEDEARQFANQLKQNIHNAQNAEPNPGKPDPVLPGNMVKVPGGNMDRPMDEKAPPGREKQIKKLKKKFDDPSAPYAIAWAQHNKHGKPQKEQRILENKTRQMEIRQQIRDLEEAKKDACYHKVRSRYKVWPSAYASGALVQCRKKGAKNWGNKSKK